MTEYIIRETGNPGKIKKKVVWDLVRCKDCKWRYEVEYHERRVMVCDFVDFRMDDMDFCSKGERIEDG